MKISNKAIIKGIGNNCPKCDKPMDRKEHPKHWKPKNNYFFTEWDCCKHCGYVQHYEEFKSSDWKENEMQESFFKSL